MLRRIILIIQVTTLILIMVTKMIDFHCHILPGVDDGFKTMEESLEQLKIAEEEGITDIVLTPHYISESSYSSNVSNNKKIFNKLNREKKKLGINVNLYLANEIYITDNIDELVSKKEVNPINDKYLLIEFPLNGYIQNSKRIIFKLISNGYKVILAHPERYPFLKENKEAIKEFLDMGVLLQGNFMSLFGRYGKHSKKLLKYYLKKNYISFLGSDFHKVTNYNLNKLKFKLRIMGLKKNYIEDVLERNFKNLV